MGQLIPKILIFAGAPEGGKHARTPLRIACWALGRARTALSTVEYSIVLCSTVEYSIVLTILTMY